jgi:mediator of RNA polymerase II transcription subunit 12, fungi type
VATLVNAHYDATGSLVYGHPVLNRPWEWMENIEEPLSPDLEEENKNEGLKPRYVVKNSACLSLETFAARATGDGLAPKCEVARDEGNIRLFEDGLSAESVFKRDWRESRVALDIGTHFGQARIRAEADEGGVAPGLNQPRGEKRSASRASPASSTRSRTSTQQSVSSSTSSRKQSLGHTSNHPPSSVVTEHVNLKTVSNTTMSSDNATKRKVTEIGDDEVEIVEGPIPLKKMKTRSSNAL